MFTVLQSISNLHKAVLAPVCVIRQERALEDADLYVGSRVDLVHSVSGRSARLAVQVITLDEHGVVAHAAHPHVALAAALQLHTFPDV